MVIKENLVTRGNRTMLCIVLRTFQGRSVQHLLGFVNGFEH
jgi:hypothetical protein